MLLQTRTASATPAPQASAPHASAPQASVPQASVPQAAVTRPSSGRVSHAESTNRPRSGKSALSEVPSVDLVDSLEGLGSINKRHEELKKRVDDLELAMENKANKDDVSGSEYYLYMSEALFCVCEILTYLQSCFVVEIYVYQNVREYNLSHEI